MALFSTIVTSVASLFKKDQIVEDITIDNGYPVEFDSNFKTIVRHDLNEYFPEIVDWIDKNSSGRVSIKCDTKDKKNRLETLYIGFENSDDALVFKIRFSK